MSAQGVFWVAFAVVAGAWVGNTLRLYLTRGRRDQGQS